MSSRPLSKELQAKAIAELNEDPKRIQDDIDIIKEWLRQERHMHARMDDQFILTFLRGCKFSLEKTKNKLENFYTLRTLIPEIYENRDPFLPELQALLKLGITVPLKPLDATSPRVLIIRFFIADPAVHKMKDLFKLNQMFGELLLNEDDQTTVSGIIVLQDTTGLSMSHLTNMDMVFMKKVMTLSEAMPQRPKAAHVFNPPAIFDTMFNLVKPFMKEKMLKRMMLHRTSNIEEMYNHIPKSVLPAEYGGDAGPIQDIIDYWKDKIESKAEWFKEDEQYKTDESKRVGKAKTESDYFGIEGSFRKLNVD